jgi:hypothetical protein
MKTSIVILAALALSACATCRDHPVACTVAGAIVVGSVAASVAQHDHDRAQTPHMSTTLPVTCTNGGTCN